MAGDREAGLDWGVETYVALAYGPSDYAEVENERFPARRAEALKVEQRKLLTALRSKRSKQAAKRRLRIARRWRKVVNPRKHQAHKLTARVVRYHRLIVTEGLKSET